MKKIFTCKVDETGRLYLPAEIRRIWGIEIDSGIAVEFDGDSLRIMPTAQFSNNLERMK